MAVRGERKERSDRQQEAPIRLLPHHNGVDRYPGAAEFGESSTDGTVNVSARLPFFDFFPTRKKVRK